MTVGSRTAPTPWSGELNFPIPFNQLSGIHILQGGKKNRDQIFVLVRFAPLTGETGDAGLGGVFLVVLKMSYDKKLASPTLEFEIARQGWLMRGESSDAEIKDRIRQDSTDGKLYFIVDPNVETTAPGFKIAELFSGKELLPNASGDRPMKLVIRDDSNDGDGDGSRFGKSASWEVFGLYKLRERYPKILPDSLDQGKLAAKLDEEEKNFPGLQASLDALVTESPQRAVFIVPDHLKTAFMRSILLIWNDRDRPKHPFFQSNYKMKLYAVDVQNATQPEVMENIEAMKRATSPDRSVIFADMADVIAVNRPTGSDDPEHPTFYMAPPPGPGRQRNAGAPAPGVLAGHRRRNDVTRRGCGGESAFAPFFYRDRRHSNGMGYFPKIDAPGSGARVTPSIPPQ